MILDPYIGSGTTAVACKQLNRNFIGFEISQEYYDIANKRLSQTNIKDWFK
jgi:site-specific DNA-methyltransferase (adenine-specific)